MRLLCESVHCSGHAIEEEGFGTRFSTLMSVGKRDQLF